MSGTDKSKAGLSLDGPIVILVEPQLGENIGMAARAMGNVALGALRIVNPRDGWPNIAAQRAAARRSAAQTIRLTGRRAIPIEVWIDEQGRVRREQIAQRVDGRSLDLTLELYGFGARDAVSPPPSSQTQDITGQAVRATP